MRPSLSHSKKNTRRPCRQLKTGQASGYTYNGAARALAHDMGHVVRTKCLMLWKLWHEIPTKTKNLVHKRLSVSCLLELENLPDKWA
ncbi:hypothetical protein D8674_006228 [Pyrus ussuriensis x Pyrus communis]|uniref:Uncharacterized protein n=1 Tax=Pyrus ussuriensis x Pyrus communis TaxID=2448454 RepID=A0A5N5FY56_9ROSA|nr:hypothetical protein D8674_006228 [Pyrus ussuriensis x Pyrus communis]